MKNLILIVVLIVALAGAAAANDLVAAVPEIGAGSAVSAVGLVAGVLLVMRSRRK